MRYFLLFCIWQMKTEHKIGSATGMNTRYLAKLREDITNMEGDLFKSEIPQ